MGSKLLCDCDCTPLLPTVIMNHFLVLRTANRYVSYNCELQLVPGHLDFGAVLQTRDCPHILL